MEILIPIIVLTAILAACATYILTRKMGKKKHWSEGYIVLGKNIVKKEEKPKENNDPPSIFPPGW